MSAAKASTKNLTGVGRQNPWDTAIREAKQQIKELRKAIKVFGQHKDEGNEWPGFKKSRGAPRKRHLELGVSLAQQKSPQEGGN
jgi:hypothetical protein